MCPSCPLLSPCRPCGRWYQHRPWGRSQTCLLQDPTAMPKLLTRDRLPGPCCDSQSPLRSEGLLLNGRDPRTAYRAWYRAEQERLEALWAQQEARRLADQEAAAER